MKTALLVLSLALSINCYADGSNADKAADLYSQRDFTEDGIKNVEKAVQLYEAAISETTDANARLTLQNKQAEAYYFLGSAYTDKKPRQLAYQNGMDEADQVMSELGVSDSHKMTDAQLDDVKARLSADQVLILANAMYQKGISTAQWGKLEGIASSIGRIGEVLGNMERIEKLGHQDINYYGPHRTIGRVKYTLPGIFGGDMAESEKYMKSAYKNTLATDASGATAKYSVNGHNNVYLAETLYKRGKEDQAKQIIKEFVNADPTTLAADIVPENNSALTRAQELVTEWNITL